MSKGRAEVVASRRCERTTWKMSPALMYSLAARTAFSKAGLVKLLVVEGRPSRARSMAVSSKGMGSWRMEMMESMRAMASA